ncbi:S-adenosyl-L-methionine-dependent methyltransferase [Aspergillus ambiguus]|uniref:tRNA(Phe) (4-demethylwyosine(37)-C(7)) aminocarboxypropyltransferase n=1 Tax=Aspergillus ambiguus TaxID=176160 RepID=UPI003CCD5162
MRDADERMTRACPPAITDIQHHAEARPKRPTERPDGSQRDRKMPLKHGKNPLQRAIQDFVTSHLSPSVLSDHGIAQEALFSSLPKRFSIYEPMLLLSVNAFDTAPWGVVYRSLGAEQKEALYATIARAFIRKGVTHVAINAPIALTDTQGQENRMRNPVGLIPLHGNFGPMPAGEGKLAQPTKDDFEQALWVRAVQNQGIVQIWSPLYTMFSRGNVTEKARILGSEGTFEGLDEPSLGGVEVGEIAVVDMYAGIGYFVFSYLRRGVKRVWGWELNAWSVEGLRRGCIANGWGCKVVRVQAEGTLSVSLPELADDLRDTDRVVVFHGDNKYAGAVMTEMRELLENRQSWNSIRHVNLGLLPSSEDAWDNACKMIDIEKGGWIHVHENVDLRHVDKKKEEVTMEIARLRSQATGLRLVVGSTAICRHVEHVKTYAPGIMHCVFDIEILPHKSSNQ